MWQSLKSLKNKFWILLSLANIILFTHDAIYMYYNFNYWGAEGFPEHYANKETYIANTIPQIIFFVVLIILGIRWQDKHPKLSKFLLMLPLYIFIFGFLYAIMKEIL